MDVIVFDIHSVSMLFSTLLDTIFIIGDVIIIDVIHNISITCNLIIDITSVAQMYNINYITLQCYIIIYQWM